MKFNFKKLLFASSMLLCMLFSINMNAQSACCSGDKKDKTACSKAKEKEKTSCAPASGETSGCTPSACRGAKTKFGEAKVISNLRSSLIDLKADMEKSATPKFDARSYDIHGIVGETDDESLAIIVREVKLVETAFAKTLNHQSAEFVLPENKAKQVKYLDSRIAALKKVL